MHSIVTTFRGAVIKVEVANFGAAIDTLIDQDVTPFEFSSVSSFRHYIIGHRGIKMSFQPIIPHTAKWEDNLDPI